MNLSFYFLHFNFIFVEITFNSYTNGNIENERPITINNWFKSNGTTLNSEFKNGIQITDVCNINENKNAISMYLLEKKPILNNDLLLDLTLNECTSCIIPKVANAIVVAILLSLK